VLGIRKTKANERISQLTLRLRGVFFICVLLSTLRYVQFSFVPALMLSFT